MIAQAWHMEAARALGEGPGTLHVQGPDPADLHGRDRRGLRFHDVAAGMTVQAMLDGDQDRLAALAAIGDELIERARDLTGGDSDAGQRTAIAEGWAAILHPENHHPELTEDGGVSFQYQHPGDVAQNLAGRRESLQRSMTALRLQSTYARFPVSAAPTDTLAADLAAARDLADNPPPDGPLHPADPIAAVAAATVVGHAQGRAVVPDDDLRWAADVIIEVATHPWADGISSESSRYPMGADRSAAAALPALLLPAFDAIVPDPGDLEEALRHTGASLADEVRMTFARAAAPVWAAPCSPAGTCRHQILWSAVIGGLRDCQLGAWDQAAQRRLIEPIGEPFAETLPGVGTEQLLVNRLTSLLIAAAEAARSDSCVARQAQDVLGPLLAAHRRGAAYWAEKNYGPPGGDQHGQAAARVLAEMAAAGDTQPLAEHVRSFTRQSPHALAELLHNLAITFTSDDALRHNMPGAWRPVMEAALDEIEASPDLLTDWYWSGMALAGLIAAPEPDLADTDPDAAIERAREDWPDPDTFDDLITRWLPIARGRPEAVDGLVKLARCGSTAWQATTGLEWTEELISGDFAAVAGRCYYLIGWLGTIRSALPGEADAARWRRIVDGLSAAGDNRAVRLQQVEE